MTKAESRELSLKISLLALDVHRATVEIHQKSINREFERKERSERQRRQRLFAPKRCTIGYSWGGTT